MSILFREIFNRKLLQYEFHDDSLSASRDDTSWNGPNYSHSTRQRTCL